MCNIFQFTKILLNSGDSIAVFDGRSSSSPKLVTIQSSNENDTGKYIKSSGQHLYVQITLSGSLMEQRGFEILYILGKLFNI